jgi:hypothetical protein
MQSVATYFERKTFTSVRKQTFGPNEHEVTEKLRILRNEEIRDLYRSSNSC